MIITEMSTLERLEDYELRSEYGSETLKYDIAAALVAARKRKNLTQIALANIAGVSQAYIAKLESGEANPTIGRIGAILASIWLKSQINIVPLIAHERLESVPSPKLRTYGHWGTTQSTANDMTDDRTPYTSAFEQPNSSSYSDSYRQRGAPNEA
jgi:transcriptional regulator with XRE-family HTH domain